LLTEKPRSARASRASIPEHVESAVERALEKLPADRYATAREFADAVQGKFLQTSSRPMQPLPRATGVRAWRARAVAAAAIGGGVLVIGGAGWLIGHRGDAETGVVRLNISVPQDAAFANIYAGPPIAISPDGMTIVYTARTMRGPQLAIRRLDELKPRVLAGTVAGIYPFFVNNGTALGFSDGAQYFRVALDGAPPTPASPTQAGAGGGADGTVDGGFVAGLSAGLLIARAFGDSLMPFTQPDTAQGDQRHQFPVVVDKNTMLFASYGPKGRRIGIASLKDGSSTVLDLPGVAPLGMIDNYLIYVRSDGGFDGLVTAAKVSLGRRKVLGEPVAIEGGVAVHGNGSVEAALSKSGTLVYSSGSTTSRMVAVDMRGVAQPLFTEAARLASPRYSPDGRRILVNRTDESSELWVYDVGSKVPTRLTTDGLTNDRPEWTADGRRVAYRSALGSYWWQRADGTDKPELMVRAGAAAQRQVSAAGTVAEVAMVPDGKRFIARIPHLGTGMDLMLGTIGDTGTVKPLVATRFNEYMPTVSHDGKWLAFISGEAGPLDVYVRSLDGSASRIPISSGGGMEPRWAPDGKHLYYRANRTIVSATISTTPTFSVTSRDTLFADVYATDPFHTNYDVSPDGRHFLMLQPVDNSQQAIVVLNFAKEVRAKMAAAKQ
jgi:serine/threonine-protein kinase